MKLFIVKPRFQLNTPAIVLGCLCLLLAACSKVVTPDQPTATALPKPAATLTPIPSLTPTSTAAAPVAVLLAGAGSDPAQVSLLQTALNDTVVSRGVRWQVRQELSPSDLSPEIRLVVALPPDPGLAELAASAPGTQFLAVGFDGLEASDNLTTLAAGSARADQQGFIAGVLAAMITDDWRVGVISLSDTVEGRAARTGFLNGVVYFCGLCRQNHPPYGYPLYQELPSTATRAEWQEAANYMLDHAVQTVYVYPGAGDENMLAVLAAARVNIISSGEPANEAPASWVTSITADPLPLIQSQVAGLLDGTLGGGETLTIPIQFTHINSAVFTPGKQRVAEQILADLQSGYIDTGVDLSSGENRP